MVAYSFKRFFAPQISIGLKNQTVRANRRRHARPGEAIQLYQGMRTRHCRKILTPDPVCRHVHPIVIETSTHTDRFIAGIELCGTRLNADDMEAFARTDGFAPEHINGLAAGLKGKCALDNMGAFWRANHQGGRFEGVTVFWSRDA